MEGGVYTYLGVSLLSAQDEIMAKRALTQPSQVETFSGVACSSMPAVYKFFAHHRFSVDSFTSILRFRPSLLLKSNSTRERLPDRDQDSDVQILGKDQIPSSGGYQLDHLKMKDGRIAKV